MKLFLGQYKGTTGKRSGKGKEDLERDGKRDNWKGGSPFFGNIFFGTYHNWIFLERGIEKGDRLERRIDIGKGKGDLERGVERGTTGKGDRHFSETFFQRMSF